MEGYTYHFVDEEAADEYTCLICTFVARNPHQVTCCGKLYCKNCLDALRVARGEPHCPFCRSSIEGSVFVDRRAALKILGLKINCSNEREGCDWQGELKAIEKHLEQCGFERVSCTNEKCKVKLQRRNLKGHLQNDCPQRAYTCLHCSLENTFVFVTGQHIKNCPDLPLCCPNNGCEQTVKRKNMDEHINVQCPQQVINCSKKCGKKMKRGELAFHLAKKCNNREATCQYCNIKGTYNTIHTSHLDKCLYLPLMCSNDGCRVMIQRRLMSKHKESCPFFKLVCTKECGKILLRKDCDLHLMNECPNRLVQCQHCGKQGKHVDITGNHNIVCPSLPVECPNKYCGLTMKRCEVRNHRMVCPKEIVQCDYANIGCDATITRESLSRHDKNNQGNHLLLSASKIVVLESKLEILQKELAEKQYKCKEKISILPQLEMDDFSQKKASNMEWYSPGFYTSCRGYKVCLLVHSNGLRYARSTHISCHICLMSGKNDKVLQWPFRGEFLIKLLSQCTKNHKELTIPFDKSTPNHYTSPVVGDRLYGGAWGECKFVPHEDKYQYLNNNCLYFDVSYSEVPRIKKDHPEADKTHEKLYEATPDTQTHTRLPTGASADVHPGPNQWRCSTCTLFNPKKQRKCATCGKSCPK